MTLSLLSHHQKEVLEEMYRLCQRKVVSAVGTKFNYTKTGIPGSQIQFLLESEILVEIATHGLSCENVQVLRD